MSNPITYYNLGITYKKLKDYEKAEKNLLLTIEINNKLDNNLDDNLGYWDAVKKLENIYVEQYDEVKLIKLYKKINKKDRLYNKLNEIFIENIDLNKINKEILDIFLDIDLKDYERCPVSLKIIQNLLKENIEVLDLHFRYSLEGKGFDEAKNDFYERVINMK